jgi:hypothetical protein
MEIAMKKILLSAAALTFAVLAGAPAYAQATRTWVSGTGDDSFPCSRTAPCKTFATAMANTASLGEINCLDTGGFGAVTIIKQITIDCTGVLAGILNAFTTGVTVNIPGGAVTLRGLTINGSGTGTVGVRITAAAKVNLENVEIFGNAQQGVFDARTSGGTVLVIQNSIIRNNTGAGISGAATSASGMVIENVISKQNQYGIAVPNGQTAIIKGSSFTNNVTAGIQVDATGQSHINDSTFAFNGTGVSVNGSASIANSSVLNNTTGFGGGGTITSFGNNRVFANGSAGQALVAAGAASTDLGQK